MRKKELEIILSQLKGFSKPKTHLEQYRTPGSIAAELLHFAYMQGDIENKIVADLGTGTGILAIGAKLLGAATVYGIDADSDAIEVAKSNEAEPFTINWHTLDISEFKAQVDTVVMNPPFGIQAKHADRPFLETARSISDTAYTIHDSNPETRRFINTFVKSLGGTQTLISSPEFELPKTYRHHSKELERHRVDLYRIEKNESSKN